MSTMHNPSHPISIRLSEDLLERLDEYCKAEDRDRTNAVRHLVRLALDQRDSARP